MESGNTIYYKSDDTDWISCFNSTRTYPLHTHATHVTIGYLMEGMVSVLCNGEARLCRKGESYYILPDTPHALAPVNDMPYSMISICLPADNMQDGADNEMSYTKKLKQMILDAPENSVSVADMARQISVSPYHMIRQFKAACGLTPHQFLIQCRVRKAQKLLEDGKSVVEAAYATGFCDQSHFDRCFYKIVRLTPSGYKRSVKRLA